MDLDRNRYRWTIMYTVRLIVRLSYTNYYGPDPPVRVVGGYPKRGVTYLGFVPPLTTLGKVEIVP